MVKTIPKRKLSPLKIILIILAVLVGLPIIFVLGSLAIYTFISTPIDKAKFESLDKDSKALFATVKQISNGAEPWVYDASCEPERAGPWATGSYFCSTKMSFEIPVSDALTVASLHTKYFPTIDAARWLKEETELESYLPNNFGNDFVVSSINKDYLAKDIGCSYDGIVNQTVIDYGKPESTYGSTLRNSVGLLKISLSCTALASGNWYAL